MCYCINDKKRGLKSEVNEEWRSERWGMVKRKREKEERRCENESSKDLFVWVGKQQYFFSCCNCDFDWMSAGAGGVTNE